MTWLEGKTRNTTLPGARLRAHMEKPQILQVPGAHNAMAGLLAKNAGFDALYVSGAALTLSMGLPDLGIMGLDELSFISKTISRATDLPLPGCRGPRKPRPWRSSPARPEGAGCRNLPVRRRSGCKISP